MVLLEDDEDEELDIVLVGRSPSSGGPSVAIGYGFGQEPTQGVGLNG